MTAQIEQHPRAGVELVLPARPLTPTTTLPRTWLEVLAFLLCGAVMALMLVALVWRMPGAAALLLIVGLLCLLVGATMEGSRHG